MPFAFDHSYARLPSRFFEPVQPTAVSAPRLLALNLALAQELGLDPEALRAPETIRALAGNGLLPGAQPIALAYAGHQFGGFVPRLGDGRAILLGEVVTPSGRRVDIQLKGAGRTPFSRGGDGRAALGPVLREYVVSEAMAALGVPTTRALAAVSTGDWVARERPLPGAVLTRVASSHLRVGTFQYFAARGDREALEVLVRYALDRHYPQAASQGSATGSAAEARDGAESVQPLALLLLDSVVSAQIRLVARWMALGFVHGVMNTDNTSIAGETIDFGPCAFQDTYAPDRVYSSIDTAGRYAFDQQPRIALWNLARLAETLLPLIDPDERRAIDLATARLQTFPDRFEQEFAALLARKLGLQTTTEGDAALARDLLERMAQGRADHTLCFRHLADVAEGGADEAWLGLFQDPEGAEVWLSAWRRRLEAEPARDPAERARAMRQVSPAFIARNHRVEEMIAAATAGDLAPFERLTRVLSRPYEAQPEAEDLARPPGAEQWQYRTFCGT